MHAGANRIVGPCHRGSTPACPTATADPKRISPVPGSSKQQTSPGCTVADQQAAHVGPVAPPTRAHGLNHAGARSNTASLARRAATAARMPGSPTQAHRLSRPLVSRLVAISKAGMVSLQVATSEAHRPWHARWRLRRVCLVPNGHEEKRVASAAARRRQHASTGARGRRRQGACLAGSSSRDRIRGLERVVCGHQSTACGARRVNNNPHTALAERLADATKSGCSLSGSRKHLG
jgi:hypothetical protein